MEDNWRFLQAYIKYYQGVSPFILDYLAVEEILTYSITGLSNKKIAKRVNTETELVEKAIKDFLNFPGWEEDLDFSPYFFYNKCYGIYILYRKEVSETSPATKEEIIETSYKVCDVYANMLNKIRREYEY